jgi:predicted ATPase/class 3 adenylate cyclase
MRDDLPTGTVTFLFTDVEGSTRLLNELGAKRYAEALADHRAVVREACVGNGGVEVDTQGDAFFFAFPTAPGALATASDLSQRLAVTGPMRVRVGVHTGTPFVGEEGYVGHDVNRTARIAAAGHGGQVLVSASTAPLVDTELTDLGEHRFKDLGAPERVFQLGAGKFPALKSLYRTNLPVPTTPFLGRHRELREVVELLASDDARLVTLTGAGGSGKTRLLLQAAAEVSERFPHGVFWVPLAPLRDASGLELTFAQALEVRERPGVAIADSVLAALVGKRALVVVDNCEHLIAGVAELVRQLVDGCPTIVVVASSRERLGLRAEHIYEVPPMASSDGLALFVDRALAVSSGFKADEHVSAICEAVDELPLAIELAAARVRSLSTLAIRERLGESLRLLATRDRDVEERQRTLDATIAWSYELLYADEQRVLRALSVFAGGCTTAAAHAVAEADLDSLESLLDKSLIRHRIDETGHDRYWVLETIREYAARELHRHGEAPKVGARHTAFFVDLAGDVLAPFGRPTSDEQRNRFLRDRANFREAHARALTAGDGTSAIRLVRCLGRAIGVTGSLIADAYATGLASLALRGGTEEDRAYALVRTAAFADALGEFDSARDLLSEAERLFDRLGDARGLADATAWQSDVEYQTGNYGDALAHAERLAALAEDIGDADLASWAERFLGAALLGRANADGDREAAERNHLLWLRQAQYAASFDSALDRAIVRANLAFSLFALEEYAKSIETAQRALREMLEIGATTVADSHDPVFVVGLAECESGNLDLGITLVSAAMRLFHESGFVPASWTPFVVERFESNVRATLGDDAHDAAVSAGEALSRDEAIELALSVVPRRRSSGRADAL